MNAAVVAVPVGVDADVAVELLELPHAVSASSAASSTTGTASILLGTWDFSCRSSIGAVAVSCERRLCGRSHTTDSAARDCFPRARARTAAAVSWLGVNDHVSDAVDPLTQLVLELARPAGGGRPRLGRVGPQRQEQHLPGARGEQPHAARAAAGTLVHHPFGRERGA